MGEIIELERLVKSFPGGIVAVDDVSLNVHEGEFITLLGPSGCGKTTTLRMIAGFESPDSGRIYLNGVDVTELPPYHRQVNTVFQDYALFPHMTIAENIGYGLRVAGIPKPDAAAMVLDALRMVDLMDKAGERPAQLSGGQKQRVALARALVRRPKVLLLDEPLSALDARLRESMRVELRHLHDKLGLTFIFVTHDQTEALIMSDRVVVMKDGRIVQQGAPTELYERPATPYVANFLGSSNLIAGKAAEAGAGQVKIELPAGVLRGHGAGFSAGDTVTACVRPEKALLIGQGSGVPNGHCVLQGVVREQFFHGSVVRLEIDIGHAELFMVDLQLQAAVGRVGLPAPGERVSVAIDPENISIFARDPDS